MRLETGYGFDRLADAHGFAVAYPNAYDGEWEACNIVGAISTREHTIDDVAFLTRMVDTIVSATGVDSARVFAVGSSRGGSMAIRLALEAPSRFHAVAAVSSSVPTPENFRCKPGARTASVLIMNGTDDPLVPFEGGEVSLFGLAYKNGMVRSSRASGQYFADLNGITAAPHTTEHQLADGVRVEEIRWGNESGVEVELVAVHGGGHGMPQPYRRRPRLLGPSPKEPNGPEMIWAFFQRRDPAITHFEHLGDMALEHRASRRLQFVSSQRARFFSIHHDALDFQRLDHRVETLRRLEVRIFPRDALDRAREAGEHHRT
jgi:polyhydroxybutyrate depolymerase